LSSGVLANGYELVNVFKDEGISGKRMDTRQGITGCLGDHQEGQCLCVFIQCLRVARSTKNMIEIGDMVAKKRATW
jgi:hypothetical protein